MIVVMILSFVVLVVAIPDLLAAEFQWLMTASLILVLLVWLQKNRKPTPRTA